MWQLNNLSSSIEDLYVTLLIDDMKQRRDAISLVKVQTYLCDNKLKWLLKSKPIDLYADIDMLKKNLFQSDYTKLISAIKSKKKNKQQKKLISKHAATINVFDYNSLISSKKNISYKIAELIGVNTCIYCNRQYIFTVQDTSNKITRPEFDHYLPKSDYPFLALSLYNLIPSCHICNSNCKGATELDRSMNPYLNHSSIDFFKFTYIPNSKGFPVSVDIKDIHIPKQKGIQKFLECFKIKDIYDAHTKLELSDLYTFATKYSKTYLQDVLSETVKNLKISQEEAYRILFGTEMYPDKDNDRPLSKFKRDILKELGVIP